MKLINILSMLVFSLCLNAQNTDMDAFKESYALEEKAEYTKAIAAIQKIYKTESYEENLRLGWLCYEAGQFTQSMTYYQKAISLKSYSIEARLGYVLPSAALGNWDQVITTYKKILDFDAQNTLVNYRLGMIYYERKDYPTAQKYFERVMNLYPFDYDSVVMNAWSYFQMGKTREARILFNKALLIRPDDASATEGLSLLK